MSSPSILYVHFKTYDMQDVFGIVPGDTDYRIFANDHGNIPGLDIIYLIGGYYYHTSTDTVERLLYAYYYFGTVRYIKMFRPIGLLNTYNILICVYTYD